MKAIDLVVLGGGIAGCALAWQCRMRGLRVLLIDHPQPDSASRVAAGLVTPVTGSRFALSWRWDLFFSAADTLYRYAEQEAGTNFWKIATAWRAFTSSQEAMLCTDRWLTTEGGSRVERGEGERSQVELRPLELDRLPSTLRDFGGVSMAPAARLDVGTYLEATREVWAREGLLLSLDVDVDRDLHPHNDSVRIPSLGVTARWAVLCQGVRARGNRWFSELPLHPARGDILSIRSERFRLDHVLHHEGWIVPVAMDRFLLGATYDRHDVNTCPSTPVALRWRDELAARWKRMTGEELGSHGAEILAHRIAVRPASYDRHPLLGPRLETPNILCFNGLGSKGSLMAPWLADHLLDHLLENQSVDPSLLWFRRGTHASREQDR